MRLTCALLLALLLTGCQGDVLDRSAFDAPSPSSPPAAATPSARPSPTAVRPAPPSARPTRARRPRRLPTPTLPTPRLLGVVEGADASWPQCPKGLGIPQKRTLGAPMPLPSARFVVLGLTNGPSFTPNPCLADQVAWVRSRRLMVGAYAVHSRPDEATVARLRDQGPYDAGSRLGAQRNVGYQQAMYAVAQMRQAGLPAPLVWIDVEPVPDFDWGPDLEANAAVIEGAVRGYRAAGLRVGFYSTPLLWKGVVGDRTFGGQPEWRAAGQTSRAEALRRCAPDWSFGGGPAVMGQWVELGRDRNLTCPTATGRLVDYFGRP
ncbi:hypothetical protein [Nocardioides marmoribigeumensis]|uniref:DUF1906 domain-containing protein n=1 Tax=Nocardioides marmoribigeumensis TaxID=433649 RepID=A0ABU2BWZ9_9ACTN|nr:hypothetical protein [Nocardioides marmoribigeumensis]MDR7362644.1 hypothetical protein [Nocardioides marmoribigeumensis]